MEEKLLKLFGIFHIVGGLLLSTFVFIEPMHSFVLEVLYGTDTIINQQQIVFWISILGPTIASWGVLFFLSVTQYFENPTKQGFWMLVGSIIIWAPIDSALCAYNGIILGAVANGSVVLVFLVLLFRIKKLTHNKH